VSGFTAALYRDVSLWRKLPTACGQQSTNSRPFSGMYSAEVLHKVADEINPLLDLRLVLIEYVEAKSINGGEAEP